jgi:alkanesulfonate monooxygenase SsuD/methylene tetrahydromethanopterin reductase-like flavin-dependent oxidoreductase (luciferase family)
VKVGICFPMSMEQLRQRELFLAWCEAADRSPLSSIALGDRIAYECQEPLISLAVAAGATKRIRLITSVVALPTRNTGMLAKEVASLDILSGGRFTLGVGMSSRPQDFACLRVPWEGRAKRFEAQVRELRDIWAGKSTVDGAPPIGPLPLTKGGPEIVFGPIMEPSFRRAGRLADGIMTWSFRPEPEVQRWRIRITEEAWQQAGRPGRPKILAAMYFALGDHAENRLKSFLKSYYAYSDLTLEMALLAETYTPQAVKDAIAAYADAGVDEILFSAADPGIDQIERLAELVP